MRIGAAWWRWLTAAPHFDLDDVCSAFRTPIVDDDQRESMPSRRQLVVYL
jgi:hypothetical protein